MKTKRNTPSKALVVILTHLTGWFQKLPPNDRAELAGRIKSRNLRRKNFALIPFCHEIELAAQKGILARKLSRSYGETFEGWIINRPNQIKIVDKHVLPHFRRHLVKKSRG